MDFKKRNIIIALMVAMFLGAVEGTVVTTAIPTIVKDLHGFELISWVFSLYLLTSAISTPIYGKLSDLYGRKNVLSVGILIFLMGSSLCGISQNMYELIGFRALQGLGTGAIFTITYTIVGDVFSLAERAKVQGWISTVWGVASLVGPFLGGFMIDYLSWHWIFFINIPFGIISVILLQRNLKEEFHKSKPSIDYAGAAFLSASIIAILLSIISLKTSLILIPLSVVFLTFFYFIEKKAAEPIIPFDIFTRVNIIVSIISFLVAGILIGTDVYLPIFIQNILGYGAKISGLALAPMSLAWLLSSIVLSKAIPKYGEKVVIVFSMMIVIIGCGLLPTLGLHSSLILVIVYGFILGFGFGGAFTTLTIVVQASVEYKKRGTATGTNSLLRTLGQTIGVSIFGGIFNENIIRYFNDRGIKGVNPSDLYSSSGTGIHVDAVQVKASLNSSLHIVFFALIVVTFACFMFSFFLRNDLKE